MNCGVTLTNLKTKSTFQESSYYMTQSKTSKTVNKLTQSKTDSTVCKFTHVLLIISLLLIIRALT